MPKKQAFIDKSGVKFVENFQKNQKIKKFPSRTEIRYLTAFMQKSQHANRVLADWIGFYNHQRPHQTLGMKSPVEVREALAA